MEPFPISFGGSSSLDAQRHLSRPLRYAAAAILSELKNQSTFIQHVGAHKYGEKIYIYLRPLRPTSRRGRDDKKCTEGRIKCRYEAGIVYNVAVRYFIHSQRLRIGSADFLVNIVCTLYAVLARIIATSVVSMGRRKIESYRQIFYSKIVSLNSCYVCAKREEEQKNNPLRIAIGTSRYTFLCGITPAILCTRKNETNGGRKQTE